VLRLLRKEPSCQGVKVQTVTLGATEQPVRVLVVDDSSSQRNMLIGMLEADPLIQVIGWASNGEEAILAVDRLKPDLVTMDLRMPIMDGLIASEHIMQDNPTPILMVTGSVSRSNQHMIAQALNAGVLGILAKPNAASLTASAEFVRMVKGLSRVRIRGRHKHQIPENTALGLAQPRGATKPITLKTLAQLEHVQVIGIAASTGGPAVLEQILTRLPKDFEIPILIVQHIAAGFAQSLVDWLNPLCNIPVRLARSGSKLESGITIASETHLTVQNGVLTSSLEPQVSGHRPSGTVLFRSLAKEYGSSALGIVLTGMGNDGALGLQNLKNAAGTVIAQDKTSSVIHSMPNSAIALGIVDAVLNPEEIISVLVGLKLEQHTF
jgi:two-component system, chemotaxis family, protein-glutamate methylesterase/glutaminase